MLPAELAFEDDVIAKAADLNRRKSDRFGKLSDAQIADCFGPLADYFRRYDDYQAIDYSRRQQRGDDALSTFNKHRRNAAASEFVEQSYDIDSRSVRGDRQAQDLDAEVLHLADEVPINRLGGGDQGATRRAIRQYLCIYRCAKPAVDDDSQRVAAFHQPDRQLWIVGEYCTYAHQDCIVLAPQLVSHSPRRGAAYPTRIASRGGYSAIKRLGKFDGDKGTPGLFVFCDHDMRQPQCNSAMKQVLAEASAIGVCRSNSVEAKIGFE